MKAEMDSGSNILFIIGFTLLGLASVAPLMMAKGQIAHAAKPDSCRQYHEKAIEILKKGENHNYARIPPEWFSTSAIAYSLVYQNCRDLERRDH